MVEHGVEGTSGWGIVGEEGVCEGWASLSWDELDWAGLEQGRG